MALQDDLLELERALWTGGADTFRQYLDDECLVAFTEMRGVLTSEEVAATVEGGPRWSGLELAVEGFLRPTEDTALLTYRAAGHRGGSGIYRAIISSGWVKRRSGWKMAFHQQTPLAGG